MRITVVGAGVIGLTTAWRLQREGHEVRVVADRSGEESTSGAAGAIWFPYLAEPAERVALWGGAAYRWLRELHAGEPDAGVCSVLPFYAAADHPRRPGWAGALPDDVEIEFVPLDELPADVRAVSAAAGGEPPGAWVFAAPVVEPRRHLSWLRRDLRVETTPERPVRDLAAVDGDLVVNCTGPRAGALVSDPELRPTLGQVVISGDEGPFTRFSWADERRPSEIVYAFARNGDAVLGGCSVVPPALAAERAWERPQRPAPLPALTAGILERWRRAGIEPPPGERVQAGWRPVRREIRLERRGRIVHNYGHGGAGFTLAYGCAVEVAELAARDLQRPATTA